MYREPGAPGPGPPGCPLCGGGCPSGLEAYLSSREPVLVVNGDREEEEEERAVLDHVVRGRQAEPEAYPLGPAYLLAVCLRWWPAR
ncbi:hypothetical protein chiPu_0029706, partial [Chiloscyllium punctatum]|nr:hypothetical protein [Chiloscyllium punctatum]